MRRVLQVAGLLGVAVLPAMGQGLLQYTHFDNVVRQYVAAAPNGRVAELTQKYMNNGGGSQNYQELGKQLSVAAEEGDQLAQLVLGLARYSGRGVGRDFRAAHMWSNLAANGSNPALAEMARTQRDQFEQNMSTPAIAQAHEMAANWKANQSSSTPPAAAADAGSGSSSGHGFILFRPFRAAFSLRP